MPTELEYLSVRQGMSLVGHMYQCLADVASRYSSAYDLFHSRRGWCLGVGLADTRTWMNSATNVSKSQHRFCSI
jgi:hypothetical protein